MNAVPHPAPLSGAGYSAVELLPDNDRVVLLDQRDLPTATRYVHLSSVQEVADAIRDMVVRGAPAIGIAAAYGMVLAAREPRFHRAPNLDLTLAADTLVSARPTAVNLAWAAHRMLARARQLGDPAGNSRVALLADEARCIHREDVENCRTLSRLGAALVPAGATILTHCNAGALATGGYGTALGVIRAAHEAGKQIRVLANETRPYLQGARLTAWELAQDGIPVEVITDNSAAWQLAKGEIDLAIVGADRIARNGDVANKIGTYAVACLCQFHRRPFYVAAPWSTVDPACPNGSAIPIEERAAHEITHVGSTRLTPAGVGVRNPSFDVTPAHLVRAIFTERGVVQPVGPESIAQLGRQA
ncbi:S-methyl-5-thioribose-1-phosphate isomerase [Myxococcota bacterium]